MDETFIDLTLQHTLNVDISLNDILLVQDGHLELNLLSGKGLCQKTV